MSIITIIGKVKELQAISETIDFEVYSAIQENNDFSLISIG